MSFRQSQDGFRTIITNAAPHKKSDATAEPAERQGLLMRSTVVLRLSAYILETIANDTISAYRTAIYNRHLYPYFVGTDSWLYLASDLHPLRYVIGWVCKSQPMRPELPLRTEG